MRALPTPTDVEIYVDDAQPLLEVIDDLPEPRIADLDALLREVDTLRSTMRRDLSLAATAAEAGEPDLAGWLLLGEGGAVRSFEARALSHLAKLGDIEAGPTPALIPGRKAARMLPAAPFVAAAAAVVGFLTGVVPGAGSAAVNTPTTSNAAMQSYAQLTELASHGASASKITDAAEQFHAALAPLVASDGANPDATEKAIALLQSERAVIAGEGDSAALRAVLAQADALVRTLEATLPGRRAARVVVPVAPVSNHGEQNAGPSRTSPKPTPSPAVSPSAAPAASPTSSPTPSPSRTPSRRGASPSASPTGSGPLPHSPAVPH
ncbi:MAG: hypothetical protein NVSMB55_22200 [Mycobacteriales bacterium]